MYVAPQRLGVLPYPYHHEYILWTYKIYHPFTTHDLGVTRSMTLSQISHVYLSQLFFFCVGNLLSTSPYSVQIKSRGQSHNHTDPRISGQHQNQFRHQARSATMSWKISQANEQSISSFTVLFLSTCRPADRIHWMPASTLSCSKQTVSQLSHTDLSGADEQSGND